MTQMKEKMSAWRDGVGFQFISMPEKDPIMLAMNLTGDQITQMSPDELGSHLVTLDGYYTYLSAEMGKIFAVVQFCGDSFERAKLNQVKPLQEAVKVKIDLYKKIYDRKVRETKWRPSDDTGSRG